MQRTTIEDFQRALSDLDLQCLGVHDQKHHMGRAPWYKWLDQSVGEHLTHARDHGEYVEHILNVNAQDEGQKIPEDVLLDNLRSVAMRGLMALEVYLRHRKAL